MPPIRPLSPLVAVTLAASLLALGSCDRSSTAPGPRTPMKRTVTVTVRDSLGAPRAGAGVWLVSGTLSGGLGEAISGYTDASGGLELELEVGAWTASSQAAGLVAGSSFHVAGVPVPFADTQLVRLVLHTPSRAHGVATLSGRGDHRDILVSCIAALALAGTDSTGAYELDRLPPGEWEVYFTPPAPLFLGEVIKVPVLAPGSTVAVPPVVLQPLP